MAGIIVYEGFPSRELLSGGDSPSEGLNWIVLGTADETVVDASVRAAAPAVLNGLLLQTVASKEIAPATWECQVKYGVLKPPKANEFKFSFDTSGGKQKITQAKQHIASYPSGTAGDHKGAIGVGPHGVEGCEIVVPRFSWTETWNLPIVDYGWPYSQVLKAITGRVNASAFRGFPAGQVLFHGGKGSASNKDPSLIEIAFTFEQSDDVTAVTIGDISGVSKAGWQYLWVHYQETDDQTAKKYVQRPDEVHVERVYDTANFALLGIGTS